LAFQKPPPLVPSCLIATCEAAGPWLSVWVGPSSVVASMYGPMFWGTPCETRKSAPMNASGSSTYKVHRVRSTQKLPTVLPEVRAKPRISAMASATPVAAETKFCVVSAAIWVR
jgi:hypothetical protein